MERSGIRGRVAVVTGAGSGIGAATARLLGELGATVWCADLNADHAEQVAKEIRGAGGAAEAYALDVSDYEQHRALAVAVGQRNGALHIAHLNAGIPSYAGVATTSVEEFDQVTAVNLKGVFYGLKTLIPLIVGAGGGSVIVTSSLAGLMGIPGGISYTAAKHGVIGLARGAAAEFAAAKVRVNAICPGGIDTPILGPLHGNEEMLSALVAVGHPLKRMGQAEEVAHLVAFLASDDSAFITGATMPIDGGASAILQAFNPAGMSGG